jgi:outer membrane protein assembly factor BamD (BamD/ComL family)
MNDIKDWVAGRNDVSLWVAPMAAQATHLGINVTSAGKVRQVGLEDMSFEAAESLGTVKAYSDFLREFPASAKATQARRAIELLAWKAACAENTRESYQVFMRTYPQSESAAVVPSHIERAVLDSTEAVNTAEAYEAFIRAFPSSPLVASAKRDIEKLIWDKVAAQNTVAACDSYIRTHPNGEFVQEARNLRQRIESEAKAEREARIEAERKAAEERRREEPLSYEAAIRQWKQFRTNEESSRGTVTTWRFKVRYTGVDHDVLGGSSNYAFGYLGEFKYPVHARGFGFGRTPSTDDWVVVTGEFEYIDSDGEVVLSVIRVKNEGYRE